MYEGKPIGTPDAGAFWRVISRAQGGRASSPRRPRSAPSRRKTRKASFIRKYDLSKFRTLFLAGERADPPTVEWAEQQLKVPVIDHWWQTETGWCIAGNPVGLGMLPVKHGSPTVPMPGYQVDVVDEAAKPVARRHHGLDRDQAAAAAGLPADAVAAGRALQAKPISTNFPATTKPPTPATRTRTAMSS